MHKLLLVAHRGDTTHFSENTIEAFESAFNLGADGIELDIQLNDLGELIVVHDYLHDTKQKYPKFSEVLEKFAHRGKLEIEVKSFDPVIVDKIADVMAYYNPPNYELTSSVLPLLSRIKKALPSANIGMILTGEFIKEWMNPQFIITYVLGHMKLTESNILHFDFDKYTPELIEKAHEENYIVYSYLKVIDSALYTQAKDLGVDQCSFDNIDFLKTIPSNHK